MGVCHRRKKVTQLSNVLNAALQRKTHTRHFINEKKQNYVQLKKLDFTMISEALHSKTDSWQGSGSLEDGMLKNQMSPLSGNIAKERQDSAVRMWQKAIKPISKGTHGI